MAAFDLVVRNGTVVTTGGLGPADIGVREGRVAALGLGLERGAREIDATGRLVMPGGIDSHVHLAQPSRNGSVCADDFATGTASALVGGTTTVCCFVSQDKGGSLAAAHASYVESAREARTDYAFHLIVTDPTDKVMEEELPPLIAAGNRTLKIFMTYDAARLDDAQVLRVLAAAKRHGTLVCVHAEHHDMIKHRTAELLAAGRTKPKHHAEAKPIVVEREAVQRIIAMAECVGTPIQIFHVSGEEPAAEIARAQARGVKVLAETCTQYLTLTAADLDRPGFEGAKYICSPALRTAADQEALWGYLTRGVIGNVTSDHSPTRYNDPRGKKIAGENAPFTAVPNGLPGLAARLPVLFSEGVSKKRIDLPTFVAIASTNAAKLLGLWPRKGTITIGADADFAVWDPERRVTLTNAMMQHGADYTPYEGMTVTGWPVTTISRGLVACDNDTVFAPTGHGTFLPQSDVAR